jgi:hypothetical protein
MPKIGIRTRFTIILTLIFIVTIIAAWAIFSRVLQQQAEDEVRYQATVLVGMLNAVRSYTSTEVRPLLAPALETQDEFIPQTVPAFSAREVFENFRTSNEYVHFLYKEATLNPTNPRDLADATEVEWVNQFRADSTLKELSGFVEREGQQVFYTARPLAIGAESCLVCHSTPENAPASLIATYGSEHGFGWNLNEIVAAQTIYIPAADVFARAQRSLTLVMGILVVIFAVVIVVTNAGLRRAVVSPVVQIARLAQLIGSDKLTPQAPELERVETIAKRSDELGHTARIIQRMAQEIYERERKLKLTIESLRIQVDREKANAEVSQITDTDYFQSLQKQVGQMRRRETPPSDPTPPPADAPKPTPPFTADAAKPIKPLPPDRENKS